MKKLMVAALAVAFAAVAQAASVTWGGTFSTPDVGDTLPAGTQFALVLSDSAFAAPTTIEAFTVGTTVGNGAIVSTWTIDGAQSDNWEFTAEYTAAGDVNGYYAILTLNDAGDKAAYMDMGSITGTTATSPMSYKVYNAGWTDESATLTSGGYSISVGGEVIPEPTSGLLLLVGMAGLALRRRRA